MSRKQWIHYHGLKHLVTRLGCTLWERHDNPMHVEELCEEILWLVLHIRAECIASQEHASTREYDPLPPTAP